MPPVPHAVPVGEVHDGPQHPLEQVDELHPLQICDEQVWGDGQLGQAAPPVPQAAVDVPGRQAPAWQHPIGQETPSQMQRPPTQC